MEKEIHERVGKAGRMCTTMINIFLRKRKIQGKTEVTKKVIRTTPSNNGGYQKSINQ